MKPHLAYIRVSTVRQGEQNSSLAEQRASITAYAQRHNLQIGEWFEEMETAAKNGRLQFNRMMTLLRTKRHGGLLVHKIDRSARNLKDWARLGELIDEGIPVHFTHESLDLSSRGGRLAADIQAVVAADFIRNLRDEVKKGMYGRLKQGFYPLPAPPGYRDHGSAKHKTIDPLKGPIVRFAFEGYATANYTLDTMREELWHRGLRGPNDKPLSKNSIASTLHNPFYYGVIKIRRSGETFIGGHEPLITKKLYDQVQEVLSGRAALRTTHHDFAYRTLIRCEHCKNFVVGERQKGHVYYRCHTKGCHQRSLREDRIEQTIFDTLANLQMPDGELMDLRACAKHYETEARKARRETVTKAEQELFLVGTRLAKLTDGYLDGEIESGLFRERQTALVERQAELRQIAEEKPGDAELDQTAEMLSLVLEARAKFAVATPEEKRHLLQALASELTAREGELVLTLRSPFDRIATT